MWWLFQGDSINDWYSEEVMHMVRPFSRLERRVAEGAWIMTFLLTLGTVALTEILIFLAGR